MPTSRWKGIDVENPELRQLEAQSICMNGIVMMRRPYAGFVSQDSPLDLSCLRAEHKMEYATNGGAICFVSNSGVFAKPTSVGDVDILSRAGFLKGDFEVPFVDEAWPPYDAEKFRRSCKEAWNSHYNKYEQDCINWSDECHFGELDESVLRRCLRIPRDGIEVRYYNNTRRVQPVCNEACFDYLARRLLGHYCSGENTIFVYCDGGTYITHGDWIAKSLDYAGFRRVDLEIPLSRGEVIVDPILRQLWSEAK